ncbi:MAG TPA: hypothetical protein VMV59_01920 [Candidatus Dormibacteraeota bacterium]|nr:hypothetical protein [Candidatus Dormibacteraeota bacterium]
MTPKRAIGGKGLNSGIRGGLWEKKHSDAMADSVWLFGWLVLRQTTERNGSGLVLRGKALTYAEISDDTGWPERTLQRWMARLQDRGYIQVKRSVYSRMVIRILHAKKFNPRQLEFPATLQESCAPKVAEMTAPSPPEVAELSPPDVADMDTKSGGLKDERKIEQKHLEREAADAADKKSAAQPAAIPSSPALVDWIPIGPWLAYVEMRNGIRRPMTNHARELAIQKLAALREDGNDPGEVLDQSVLHAWTGLYPVKEDEHGGSKGNRKPSGAVAPTPGKYDHLRPEQLN